MKKLFFTLTLGCFASSLFSQDLELKFDIENQTGIDLFAVYVTQADVDHWGSDIIPGDLFHSGNTVEVTVPVENSTICEHDIKVTDHENNSVVFENINFCTLEKLSFFIEEGAIHYTVK